MTDIEKFKYTHNLHDYILFNEKYNIFATICCTEAELAKVVKEVYNNRRSVYKAMGYKLPEKIIAHQTYSDKEKIFNF